MFRFRYIHKYVSFSTLEIRGLDHFVENFLDLGFKKIDMKRELAFALEVQSQLCKSLGRTRASKVAISSCNGGLENTSRKRRKGSPLKEESEVNSSTDHNRVANFQTKECNGVSSRRHASSSTEEGQKSDAGHIVGEVQKNDLVVIGEKPERVPAKSSCEETPNCESTPSIIKEDPRNGIVKPLIENGHSMVTPMVIESDKGVRKATSETPPRRFTRSALKPNDDSVEVLALGNNISCVSEGTVNKAIPRVEEKEITELSTFRTPTKKLELKMSKKVSLTKIPSNVKELLETGLLEGFQVTYHGKKKGSGLRGVIKGAGILCSCLLCKGCKVVAPSKFVLHACNSYRRMSYYVHLDNGKSFLDLLKACKDTPLETLESTIQSAIGSLPVKSAIGLRAKKSVISKKCKSSFTASSAAKISQLHNSCTKSKKSKTSPTQKIGKRAKLSESTVASNSAKRDSSCFSSEKKFPWKMTTKDTRLHKLVFEKDGLPDGTELGYYARGKKLLEGYKQGSGIFCCCCNTEVSASQFEAHAGCATRRKPYSYIYTSNGVSLHELSVSLSKGRKYSAKDNDDACIICADGGDLLLCDGCPRAFHKECASLSSIPPGDWFCKYCQTMFQREKHLGYNANAVAAGRISGADPIEEIAMRCIRIVENPGAAVTSCVLCRGDDFSISGFGPRTIILCDQCEKEYHIGCLKEHKMADLKELPTGNWFCCMDCERIHSILQKLLVRGAGNLPDSLLNVIKKKSEFKGSDTNTVFDVKWRLISGKIASPETRLLLSKAVAIFHENFDPINDSKTGNDLIPSMVYGRNTTGQEFEGMYCAVLIVNSSVVSAATLRIYGSEVAELPLVATTKDNQGKGYFQVLFSCLERLLAYSNVKSIVLPSAEDSKSIWTDKFGFTNIAPDQIRELRRRCFQMMTFRGTSMLQKMVPECLVTTGDVE